MRDGPKHVSDLLLLDGRDAHEGGAQGHDGLTTQADDDALHGGLAVGLGAIEEGLEQLGHGVFAGEDQAGLGEAAAAIGAGEHRNALGDLLGVAGTLELALLEGRVHRGGDLLELGDSHGPLDGLLEAGHVAARFDERDEVGVGEALAEQFGGHGLGEVIVLDAGVVDEVGQERAVVLRLGLGGVGGLREGGHGGHAAGDQGDGGGEEAGAEGGEGGSGRVDSALRHDLLLESPAGIAGNTALLQRGQLDAAPAHRSAVPTRLGDELARAGRNAEPPSAPGMAVPLIPTNNAGGGRPRPNATPSPRKGGAGRAHTVQSRRTGGKSEREYPRVRAPPGGIRPG